MIDGKSFQSAYGCNLWSLFEARYDSSPENMVKVLSGSDMVVEAEEFHQYQPFLRKVPWDRGARKTRVVLPRLDLCVFVSTSRINA